MQRTDYGIVSHEELTEPATPATVGHDGLTARLGCTATRVDAYSLANGQVTLTHHPEQLCLPFGDDGRLTGDRSMTISPPTVAFVPAGAGCTLASTGTTTWLVISAPGTAAPDRPAVAVDPTACTFTTPETSDVLIARLTGRLGCMGMKVNARRLNPGQAVPYHTEGSQEELFVPVTGPGTMRIAETTHQLPRGALSRVGPETPRSAVNETDTEAVWVMVGAPPTGRMDEWDPGAVILE